MNDLKQIALNRVVILVALMIAVGTTFEPLAFAYTQRFHFMVYVYEWGRVLSFIGAIIAYCCCGPRRSILPLVMVALITTCCCSSLLNGASIEADLRTWFPCLTIILVVATASKSHFQDLLLAVFVVTGLLCLLNLISMIAYPDGMYNTATMSRRDCYFWGHRNNSYSIFIPAIVAILCIDRVAKKAKMAMSISIFGVSFAMVILKFSATSFIALSCLAIFVICVQNSNIRRYINGMFFMVAYLVLFVGIVLLRSQDLFSPIFELLGKDSTFTFRTVIWDNVIHWISDPDHILLGYGMDFTQVFTTPVQITGSAHNMLLQICLIGGIIGCILFLGMLFIAASRLYRKRRCLYAAYISIALGALLIIGLMENTTTKIALYLVLALAYYCPYDREVIF